MYNVLTPVIVSLISFFMVPFLVKSLGAEVFGIWILIGSIFRYRNMLSLGLNSAINRQNVSNSMRQQMNEKMVNRIGYIV